MKDAIGRKTKSSNWKKDGNQPEYQRFSSVLITGIPITVEHNDLEQIILKLFNKVCYPITDRDIIAVHRVSRNPPKVLVKFVNKRDATSLLDGKVVLGELNNGDLGLGHCEKFFLEEHLTPYISKLAFKCRCLKRSGKILKTKVNKEVVRILKGEVNGLYKWHDILHIEDIEDIEDPIKTL